MASTLIRLQHLLSKAEKREVGLWGSGDIRNLRIDSENCRTFAARVQEVQMPDTSKQGSSSTSTVGAAPTKADKCRLPLPEALRTHFDPSVADHET